jgi:hypothetical protein
MAQKRKVIQSIGEATCENCIYSRPGEEKHYCARKFHADIGYECEPGDWCGMGMWMTRDSHDRRFYPQTLNDLFYEFNGRTHETT